MNRVKARRLLSVFALSTALGVGYITVATHAEAQQRQVTLNVFMGTQQRPEIFQPIFDRFTQANPNIKIRIETGGATSEQQNAYLTTVLAARDTSLDVFLIDVVRTATFASAGWAEPLDALLPQRQTYLQQFLPGTISSARFNNRLYAVPAFTDAQFLYYRKDLLEKYKARVPRTWEEMIQTAQRIQKAEGGNIQGWNFQAAPIEGTVCNFLQLVWTGGGDGDQVNSTQGRQALQFMVDAVKSKISPASSAEIRTDDSRKQFQAGQAVFSNNWSYAWAHFQGNSPDPTKVKGEVGVAPLPVFGKNKTATCVGGWEWALNAFGRNKPEAAKLLQFMASPEVQREIAVKGAYLPVRRALYNDRQVLQANPHFKSLYSTVLAAKARPASPAYPRISEIIRTNVSAAVAGNKTVEAALRDMQRDLDAVR
ncbi:ABC transporter substrate-binding protein [Deinococcus yavapaiensis]|uniref:Carbohydrate ABC transporter substrate-binding protein (CUT1 family) n=1 Tax=Deinococcus yavapaiensis KR-236 TaxID=694435 RepID=A0A318SC90_9DEIO|nr:ABC transporter substrate-binding protein [Deinococcus yavapaiensis]PYE48946.1 carbohydrate ABC transporter substrate-binding protein (CUT1 family) [Deinococcus yavapaiensis KR-236]